MICRNDCIKEYPDLVGRVLNSFGQAEEYVERHPTEAKAILRKRYLYDDGYIARVWPEAGWMIGNKMTTEKQVPDFLNYIYEDGLKAVRPEAVNIIR